MNDETFKWVDIQNAQLTRGQHAKLSLEAVSQCCKINPSNPMAVAENIENMYQALLDCQNIAEYHNFKGLKELLYEIKKGE